MSFLKIGDRAAGAIKSGGTTRRAAKMVVVDIDHPDIEDYIDWKVKEEQKVAALVTGSKIVKQHLKAIMKACVNCEAGNDDCFDPKPRTLRSSARSRPPRRRTCRRTTSSACSSSRAGLHRDRVQDLRHRLGFGSLPDGVGPELQQLGARHRRVPARGRNRRRMEPDRRKRQGVAKTVKARELWERSAMPPGPPPIRASSSTPP
jgi:ribonucleotide reductase alpha subunit